MSELAQKRTKSDQKKALYLKGDEEVIKFLNKTIKRTKSTRSAILTSIVKRHVKIYSRVEENKEIFVPREIITILYDSLDKKQSKAVIESTVNLGINYLKKISNDPSFEQILASIEHWFEIRGMHLEIVPKDEEEYRLSCKHSLGENWSKITMNTVIKLLKKGCAIKINSEYTDDEFFINIKKLSS